MCMERSPGERLTRRTDLESPRPAPVARLAARFAHPVRCSACVVVLPGAGLALSRGCGSLQSDSVRTARTIRTPTEQVVHPNKPETNHLVTVL